MLRFLLSLVASAVVARSLILPTSSSLGRRTSHRDNLLSRRGGDYVDVTIQFLSADLRARLSDHIGGTSNPYFKVDIDGQIRYISSVQKDTLRPTWNEEWHILNVPHNAELSIKVLDRERKALLPDGHLGSALIHLDDIPEDQSPQEVNISGKTGRHGEFFYNIIRTKTQFPNAFPYTFAGPIRYSKHQSPTVSLLISDDTFATWEISIMGITDLFGDAHQEWNHNYGAAKTIFGHNPVSAIIRQTILAGHQVLYARGATNEFGILPGTGDFLALFKDQSSEHRMRPVMYTYVIMDDVWRFSETGAAFATDHASKHAMHAGAAPRVRYSGEFHWRPNVDGYWSGFSNDIDDSSVRWELVIDNNSGTYAPDKNLLPNLKKLLEFNWPELDVVALDYSDPNLKESTTDLKQYEKAHRALTD